MDHKEGNTCDGISILRSKDSLRFNEIDSIPCICGSPYFAESFQLSDNNPIQNQTNYYRLQLGQNGLSLIVAVDFFRLGDANELLFPNPTSGNAMLILNNLNKQEIIIRGYDISGNILLTETNTDSRFALPSNDWNTGHYLIASIRENGSERSVNKMMVIRN